MTRQRKLTPEEIKLYRRLARDSQKLMAIQRRRSRKTAKPGADQCEGTAH